MATSENLGKKAPIVEAIIEIRTQPRELDKSKLYDQVSKCYPAGYKIEKLYNHSVEIKVGEPGASSHSAPNIIGLRVSSEDNQEIIQFKKDGFVYSQLKPYPGWDAFYQKAEESWLRYSKITETPQITRIGLRYINKILLPHGIDTNFQDFFPDTPAINDEQGNRIVSFVHNNVYNSKINPAVSFRIVKATQDVVTKENELYIPIILDIDVFQQVNNAIAIEQIKGMLSEMRAIKNEAFFNNITESCKKLILGV